MVRHNFDRRSFIKAVSTLAVIGSVEPFLNRGVWAAGSDLVPPPDLFDPGLVDLTFWLQPRTLEMVRPQSGERLNITYWKDGHLNQSPMSKFVVCFETCKQIKFSAWIRKL